MGTGILLAATLAVGLTSQAAAAGAPTEEASSTTWVAERNDGEVVSWSSAESQPDLTEARWIWRWSAGTTPCRVPSPVAACPAEQPSRQIEVSLRERAPAPEQPQAARDDSGEVVVVSAPAEMWSEVPEPFLPRFRGRVGGRLQLRAATTLWRVRAIGGHAGSVWVEVPANRRSAVLDLFPAAEGTLRVAVSGRPSPSRLVVQILEIAKQGRGGRIRARFEGPGAVRLPPIPDLEPLSALVSASGLLPRALQVLPSQLSSTITLEAGATIEGQVVDDKGKPVEGAQIVVEAWADPSAGVLASVGATTGADGRFGVSPLPLGEVGVIVSKPGFATLRETFVNEDAVRDVGRLSLEPGVQLELTVVDADHLPVAECSGRLPTGEPLACDEAGVLRLDDAGSSLVVAIDARGFLEKEFRLARENGLQQVVVLERAFVVTGRFLGRDGLPLVGAGGRVVMRLDESSRSWPFDVEPGGTFALELPPDAATRLELFSPSVGQVALELEPGRGGEERLLPDIVPPLTREVSGRVVDSSGGSVAGVAIWSPRQESASPLQSFLDGDILRAISESDGTFVLAGVGTRAAEVSLDTRGWARRVVAVPAGDEDIDLGEVVLAAGGTVRVTAGGEASGGRLARLDPRGSRFDSDSQTASLLAGEAVFTHVPAGRQILTIERGYEVLCRRDLVVEDEIEAEVVCGGDESEVVGFVMLGEERAGAGTLMWFPSESAFGVIVSGRSAAGANRVQVHGGGLPQVDVAVELDGSFRTRRLSPGAWQVVFLGDDRSMSAPLPVTLSAETEEDLRLAYPRSGITGRVVDVEGEPAAGVRVSELRSGTFTLTDEAGSFRLIGLEPGARTLQALSAAGEKSDPLELEAVAAPEDVVLRLRAEKPELLEVLVRGIDGGPLAGSIVFLETDLGRSAVMTTDALGRARSSLDRTGIKALRGAAWAAGRWLLGSWVESSAVDEALVLEVEAGVGELRVRDQQSPGNLELSSASGWSLGPMLRMVGAAESDGGALRIPGLPAGAYIVAPAGRTPMQVWVEADRTVEVDGATGSAIR